MNVFSCPSRSVRDVVGGPTNAGPLATGLERATSASLRKGWRVRAVGKAKILTQMNAKRYQVHGSNTKHTMSVSSYHQRLLFHPVRFRHLLLLLRIRLLPPLPLILVRNRLLILVCSLLLTDRIRPCGLVRIRPRTLVRILHLPPQRIRLLTLVHIRPRTLVRIQRLPPRRIRLLTLVHIRLRRLHRIRPRIRQSHQPRIQP
jgi:hypothetical protein